MMVCFGRSCSLIFPHPFRKVPNLWHDFPPPFVDGEQELQRALCMNEKNLKLGGGLR